MGQGEPMPSNRDFTKDFRGRAKALPPLAVCRFFRPAALRGVLCFSIKRAAAWTGCWCAWATPATSTRTPATTPALWWPTSWPSAVHEAAAFYKIPPEHILVVSDEVALAPGKLRVRRSGSAGGHNGLKNIIAHLGTDQFPRIRVGVGQKPHPDYDMADWVLGKFQGEDKKAVEAAVKRAADAAECLIREGVDKAMNKYNG